MYMIQDSKGRTISYWYACPDFPVSYHVTKKLNVTKGNWEDSLLTEHTTSSGHKIMVTSLGYTVVSVFKDGMWHVPGHFNFVDMYNKLASDPYRSEEDSFFLDLYKGQLHTDQLKQLVTPVALKEIEYDGWNEN
jgi:hypothetical protein